MASAGPAPSGKRAYDAEINLVPFIDLLSCCICFLLISAVWTQVAKIDVKPAPNAPAEQMTPPSEQAVKLTVHIRGAGYWVTDGTSNQELAKQADVYPVKELDTKLAALREQHPDVTDVTVMSDDVVNYKELVSVMDLCLKHGLQGITVSSSGA